LIGLKIGQLWHIDNEGFDYYLENATQSVDLRYGPKEKATD
jgi:hypothetical protein